MQVALISGRRGDALIGSLRYVAVGAVSLALVCSGSCVRSKLVECAGGMHCPAGHVCDNEYGRCLKQEQLVAECKNPDGSNKEDDPLVPCTFAIACDTPDAGSNKDENRCVQSGFCDRGACVQSICGNQVVEIGERCDPPNPNPDEYCSDTCDSKGVCPNGVVDAVFGELCDDGNYRNNDGCAQLCEPEQIEWSSHRPRTLLKTAISMAYGNGRLMLFGNHVPGPATWFLEASTLRQVPERLESPPTCGTGAMVFDQANNRMVCAPSSHAELWMFQDGMWQKGPAPPVGLRNSRLAYDSGKKRIALFWRIVAGQWVLKPAVVPRRRYVGPGAGGPGWSHGARWSRNGV